VRHVLAKARKNLPNLPAAQVHLEHQQLVRVGVVSHLQHLAHAQVKLGEIIVCD
jgi:hypothetical protein